MLYEVITGITDGVSVRVVDTLEMVDVENDQAQWLAGYFCLVDQCLSPLCDEVTVINRCQAIAHGHFIERLVSYNFV